MNPATMLARIAAWTTAFALMATLGAAEGQALTLEPIGTFAKPIFVTSDPGNADRLFVVERAGKIQLVEGEDVTEFVDLTALVRCCEGEQGLSSMAPAPDFGTTGKFYIAYTGEDGPGNIHVDELTAVGDTADPLGRREVLTVPHSDDDVHNGGQLQFGPDGLLYLSTGDGSAGVDPFENAQDLDSQLGKILRIDPEPDPPLGYTVPADNPFLGGSPESETVWTLGLRNPFRFSFDSLTGDLAIADVGEQEREELNWAPSPGPAEVGGGGANYGWSCREGLLEGPWLDPACIGKTAADFVDPAFDYPHENPENGGAFGCSIIGGYVARDPQLGALYGRYVYADFCVGDLRSLQPPAGTGDPAGDDCSLGIEVDRPTSFGEDSGGRLYVTEIAGAVSRIAGPPFDSCPTSPDEPADPPASEPKTPLGALPTIGIGSSRSKVGRGALVSIEVRVTPCEGNAGGRVRLLRGGRPNGSGSLDRTCTARFQRRVRHRSTFRATFSAAAGAIPLLSRRLTIGIVRRATDPSSRLYDSGLPPR